MNLSQLVKRDPRRLVKLTFDDGCTVTLTAQDAAEPNASMRYFPNLAPGESYAAAVARLGWKKPWYYAEEVIRIEVL